MNNKINYTFHLNHLDICDTGFKEAKKMVTDKIASIIQSIEDHFEVKIDFNFDGGNPITINAMVPIEIVVKKDYAAGYNAFVAESKNHSIKLSAKYYAFSLNNKQSEFIVQFNANLDLENLTVLSTRRHLGRKELQYLVLTFDKNFKLLTIHHTNNYHTTFMDKNTDMVLPYADELQLFRIREMNPDCLIDDFPEFFIPSAYDFNSQVFAERMEVFSMLSC